MVCAFVRGRSFVKKVQSVQFQKAVYVCSCSLGIGHSHPLPVTEPLLVPRWWTYLGPDFGKWWPDPPPPSMPAYTLRKNCLPRWGVDGGVGDDNDGDDDGGGNLVVMICDDVCSGVALIVVVEGMVAIICFFHLGQHSSLHMARKERIRQLVELSDRLDPGNLPC